MNTIELLLHRSPFFAQCDEVIIQRIATIATLQHYEKENILFYEGDTPTHLLFLGEGIVKMTKMAKGGKTLQLHRIEGGAFIAEAPTFEGRPYPATCEALTSVTVVSINFPVFCRDFLTDPLVALGVIRSLSHKLRIMSHVLDTELMLDAPRKLARFLLDNTSTATMLKHVELASLLNMKPETLSRSLAKLKEYHILLSTNPIVVADYDKLFDYYTQ